MARHNHKPHAQKLNRIFYAGIVFQRHNITGNPDHEQLADALIKHQFRYGTCVGTSQNHVESTLLLDQHPARGRISVRVQALSTYVSLVAHNQPFKRFAGADRMYRHPTEQRLLWFRGFLG